MLAYHLFSFSRLSFWPQVLHDMSKLSIENITYLIFSIHKIYFHNLIRVHPLLNSAAIDSGACVLNVVVEGRFIGWRFRYAPSFLQYSVGQYVERCIEKKFWLQMLRRSLWYLAVSLLDISCRKERRGG